MRYKSKETKIYNYIDWIVFVLKTKKKRRMLLVFIRQKKRDYWKISVSNVLKKKDQDTFNITKKFLEY